MDGTGSHRIKLFYWLLPPVGLAAALLIGKGAGWVAGLTILVLLIGCVLAAVQHAELVGHWLGEPYGTLLLTLAVTVIEVALIVSLMFAANPNPALVRDTMHAVVMLVVHGIAGLCIVVGTLRRHEQEFQTAGASAFLTVLIPMVTLVLVLPNHTITAPGPYYSSAQLGFVAVACLGLYGAFLFVQTVRHRHYFLPLGHAEEAAEPVPSWRRAGGSTVLLVLALIAVVLLAKLLAPFIEAGITAIHLPRQVTGVIVAAIVLLPETLTALNAARRDRLQTSINLALGSGVASIGLTIPTVAVISIWLDQPLALGVDGEGTVLLALSFLMTMITYGQGRTNLLSGFVHLVVLACYLFLIITP